MRLIFELKCEHLQVDLRVVAPYNFWKQNNKLFPRYIGLFGYYIYCSVLKKLLVTECRNSCIIYVWPVTVYLQEDNCAKHNNSQQFSTLSNPVLNYLFTLQISEFIKDVFHTTISTENSSLLGLGKNFIFKPIL